MNDAPCHCIATGIPGAEGPTTDSVGQLWLVSPSAGEIRTLENGQILNTIANTGGVPAGLQLDAQGHLWIADMKKGILRLRPDGTVVSEISKFEGAPLRGCNDLCFDHDGNLYFTAPAGSSVQNACGEVFCRLKNGRILRIDSGFAFCNGLAISANGERLIVAETFTRSLWAYDLSSPGMVSHKRLFAMLPGTHRVGADGMDFDAAGHLIAANYGEGTLDIFDHEGGLVRRITLPFGKPSNLHFAGPDSNMLFVTEHDTHGLWRLEYGAPGQFQPGWKRRGLRPGEPR